MQFQYNGMPLPLPQWFVQGHNANPKKVNYSENVSTYIRNTVTDYNKLLNELNQRSFYKPQERLPFSAFCMPYIYIIHHFKGTGYFLKKFPVLSLPLVNKIQQGCVDALKALKTVYDKVSFSDDCILMIDEMYLQKSA